MATYDDLYKAIDENDIDKVRNVLLTSHKDEDNQLNFIDEPNIDDLTPLMLAARNNNVDIAQILVKHRNIFDEIPSQYHSKKYEYLFRANTEIRNSNGYTAAVIARQYKSRATLNILNWQRKLTLVNYPTVNYFSHAPLNRLAEKRKDSEWLKEQMKNPESKYIIFKHLQPLAEKSSEGKSFRLVIVSYGKLAEILEEEVEQVTNSIFLGVKNTICDREVQENDVVKYNRAWFAIDIGDINEIADRFLKLYPGTEYLTPRPGFLQVNVEDATILAQARPILEWHQFNKFCARCGSRVHMEDGGYKQTCSNEQCASNKKILNVSYPRMDPVSIMLVISKDGSQCLLGRKAVFPAGMYSCLAGFMEPGETIEDAVRREVLEESGIHIGLVEYHSSQFWPYPAQLMIGCLAHATSTGIIVDKEELEDVQWFDLNRVRKACREKVDNPSLPPLFFPPKQAIARQLIEHWVDVNTRKT